MNVDFPAVIECYTPGELMDAHLALTEMGIDISFKPSRWEVEDYFSSVKNKNENETVIMYVSGKYCGDFWVRTSWIRENTDIPFIQHIYKTRWYTYEELIKTNPKVFDMLDPKVFDMLEELWG